MEPANVASEQSDTNLSHIRIDGKSDDSDQDGKKHLFLFANNINNVDLVFVDSYSEQSVEEDHIASRVLIKVLKQKNWVGVAFEREIKHVYRIFPHMIFDDLE